VATWEGLLLSCGILGVVGAFETAYLFLIGTFDFVRYCKLTLTITFVIFAAFGGAAFGVAYLLRPIVGIEIGGVTGGTAGVVVAALALTQGTRIDFPRKTEITASPSLPGDRESYYAKLIRWRRCALYRRIVGEMPRGLKHFTLVLSGLQASYPLEETVDQFQSWLDDKGYAADSDLCVFLRKTSRSTRRTKQSRASILLRRLLREDMEHGVHLAKCAAAAIVDQHALR